MRGFYDFSSEYFVQLLEVFPGGLEAVRGHLRDQFGILVGDVSPDRIWEAIERDRGEEGAADVVSELVISKGGPRVQELVARAAADEDLYLRADDPRLARLLFQEEDLVLPEVGDYVAEYYERTRPFLEEAVEEPRAAANVDEIAVEEAAENDELDVTDLIAGRPRPSAAQGAKWSFERIQNPSRGYLTVPGDWLESDLEQFIWHHWGEIDLGLDGPLHLIERQAVLRPNTSDRVDLLARGNAGEWVAIELKIGEARRGDLTQLLSYMADLERRGESKSKVRGILIAPSFAAKVTNAASADPRVTLLRFHVGE